MENSSEIKNALANFLGFAMSKSKELDNHIIPGSAVSKNTISTDVVIAKAANEIEQKFGRVVESTNTISAGTADIASMLIPMPDLNTRPIDGPRENYIPAANIHPQPEVSYVPGDADQLEFNFVEPNSQTKLILDEIKLLSIRVNNIIRLLEDKKPIRKKK